MQDQLKIAFVKKRLLMETIQDVFLLKGKKELDSLASAMQECDNQSKNEIFSQEIHQQLKKILDRRIQSLRSILPSSFHSNIPTAEILKMQKQQIINQAKILLIQVFHRAIARCATSLRNLEVLA